MNFPAGEVLVEFLPCPNWNPPAGLRIPIQPGQPSQACGTYTRNSVSRSEWMLY